MTLYLVACFDDRLVEGGAAGLAVAAAAGGDAERFGSVVERATGVAWLGAHVGLDHSADRAAALVGDGDVACYGGAALGAGGRTGALDGLSDAGVGGGETTGMAERPVVVADEGVIVGGEAVVDRGTDQRDVSGVVVPGIGDLAAMAGGEEVERAALDQVEAERATVPSAVGRIPDCQQGPEHAAGVF